MSEPSWYIINYFSCYNLSILIRNESLSSTILTFLVCKDLIEGRRDWINSSLSLSSACRYYYQSFMHCFSKRGTCNVETLMSDSIFLAKYHTPVITSMHLEGAVHQRSVGTLVGSICWRKVLSTMYFSSMFIFHLQLYALASAVWDHII